MTAPFSEGGSWNLSHHSAGILTRWPAYVLVAPKSWAALNAKNKAVWLLQTPNGV